MLKNVLITGLPKSGKSTLLKRLVASISNKIGLVTHEIIGDNGREGFELETHQAHKEILAHVNFNNPIKVSRYSVNPDSLKLIIPELIKFNANDFLYLDEIGQMQLFSTEFKALTLKYLDSPNTCLATISYVYNDDFTKSIKERDDVILVELTPETREKQEAFVSELLKKIEKARRYISEPTRFTFNGPTAELVSEHSTRKLTKTDNNWQCSCDFFARYEICSHIIAVKEINRLS